MNNTRHRQLGSRSQRGIALVIVLAFVVLLTGLVVAYLSRTSTDRQLAHGTFNEAKADQLARSALNIVVGDLKQEIVDGSASPAPSPGGSPIYIPSQANYILPLRSGNPTGSPDPVPNLVRRSVQSDPMAPPGVTSRASNLSSAPAASASPGTKRGEITAARWNKHYLIPRATPGPGQSTTTTYTDPVSRFVAPDWVFVTADGPSVLSTPSPSVVGRYAYAVYDEGGLIDMNVAGFPTESPSPFPAPTPPTYGQAIGRKGSLGFADLTALGMSHGSMGDVAGWRNYASIQPAGSFTSFTFDTGAVNRYAAFLAGNTNGFLSVDSVWNGHTNQAFTSRQVLLAFRTSSGFSQDAVQFLGTFSRDLDIPTWSPVAPDLINPELRTLRVTASFTRNDGTTANIGDPFINKRFLLQRLNWLTYKGASATRPMTDTDMALLTGGYNLTPAFLQQGTDLSQLGITATTANIYKYFGLAWDAVNERWNYIGHPVAATGASPPATGIATLGSIVGIRDPDFFELLQAGILNGSLGDSVASAFPVVHQQSKMLQILAIGANLISQATVDSYPTRIACTVNGITMEAVGSERLPYINMLGACAVGSSLSTGGVSWFLIPNIWDPFRNTSPLTTSPLRPPVQLSMTGNVSFVAASGGTTTTVAGPVAIGTAGSRALVSGTSNGGRDGLSGGYPEAAKLDTGDLPASTVTPTPAAFNAYPFAGESSNGTSAAVAWRTTNALTGSNKYVTMRGGHPGSAITPAILGKNPALQLNAGFQVTMDYQSPTNPTKWYSYSFLQGNNSASTAMPQLQLTDTRSVYANVTVTPALPAPPFLTKTIATSANTTQITPWSLATLSSAPTFVKSDPRSTRFNSIVDSLVDPNASPAPVAAVIKSIWPNGPSPQNLGSGATNPALYAQNVGSYNDSDGQNRKADNGPGASNPYAPISPPPSPATTAQFGDTVRPLVINRPFRSVGEMGYAFRDQPFKTIDFLTSNSADLGLLDLFTVNENANASRMRAGVVSANTRQVPVLAAMISRTLLTDDISPTDVSAVNATAIAANLLSRANAVAFAHRGEVVNGVANDTNLTLTKTQHEAIVRGFAENTQTRTWNLMIDVIAQSGRNPRTATTLNDFVVEGEKRYWLHVAIDRFTGQVIDQQLEAVYE